MVQNRPEKVATAVALLYITLGMGVLRSIVEASMHADVIPPAFVIIVNFCVLGIYWLLIYKIGKGRNWARITFLVLFIIGIPFLAHLLLKGLPPNPVPELLGIGQMILQVVALVYLFQKRSSDWFREMKANK